MFLTKEQAREKKCCRPGDCGRECQADGCMAWRWEAPKEEDGQGYCGLAGEPNEF